MIGLGGSIGLLVGLIGFGGGSDWGCGRLVVVQLGLWWVSGGPIMVSGMPSFFLWVTWVSYIHITVYTYTLVKEYRQTTIFF